MLALVAVPAAAWFVVEGGRYLQHEDPLRHADAIFVLAGTRLERPLEAADLYRDGYAPLIVLSPGRIEHAERVLQQRGVTFPREEEVVRGILVGLGLPEEAVELAPGDVDNTAQEATLLERLAAARQWRTVIVVTSKFHTRRTGFALRRALAGTPVQVVVRASRYDSADPARWWRSRADFRFATLEWQKLIAYRLGLGG